MLQGFIRVLWAYYTGLTSCLYYFGGFLIVGIILWSPKPFSTHEGPYSRARAADTGAEAPTVIGEYRHEDKGKDASKWDLCQQQHAEEHPCWWGSVVQGWAAWGLNGYMAQFRLQHSVFRYSGLTRQEKKALWLHKLCTSNLTLPPNQLQTYTPSTQFVSA